ncbi:hypothetical protein G9C85_10430 [Halorubellus sp. JP-L1]|uniref:hypothetical protein n=1 Tax=Halorubellus sp. JP-L1 TaxID=2715753 RepID=UPI00140B57C9|nr:hypothetical protein [Halorubellus sp. JP-L1]NHN42042.1 hypothetical protein [Halorubellus sp. JP-L1]
MADDSTGLVRSARVATRVLYVALVVHALYVVLTADWPAAAAFAFVLVAWYDYRASTTLRRVRRRLLAPA